MKRSSTKFNCGKQLFELACALKRDTMSLSMKKILSLFAAAVLMSSVAQAADLPARYVELNDYVVEAPNQGQVNTCLFMGATGAMEVLLNKKLGIKHPKVKGDTDISERYTISEVSSNRSKSWFEDAFLKFDSGEAVLTRDMPFESFDEYGDIDYGMWNVPSNFDTAPRIKLPKVDTVFLFAVGNKYSRGVLTDSYVKQVKEALVKYQSPVITVGNDEDYWHVTVITGYDDTVEGDCYEIDSKICAGKKGVFYVRDSFGVRLEARSYEWFIRRQNSAAVAKLAE
jgi:hypothetical protein